MAERGHRAGRGGITLGGLLCTATVAGLLWLACGKRPVQTTAIVARAPKAPERGAEAVTGLAHFGFTHGTVCSSDPGTLKSLLDAAHTSGILLHVGDPALLDPAVPLDSALSRADRLVRSCARHPACAGYWLGPVADTALFARAAVIRQHLAAADRQHRALLAMSVKGDLHTRIAHLKPEVLVFGEQGVEGGVPAANFFAHLGETRRLALAAHLPWWGTVVEAREGDQSELRDHFLRFQAMSLLAYGAQGIEWGLDWGLLHSWATMHGPAVSVARTLREINDTAGAWLPILAGTSCVAVSHSDPVPAGQERVNLEGTVYRIDGEYVTLAFFRGARRREQYLMVLNRNYMRGAKPRLFFSERVKGLAEIAPEGVAHMAVSFSSEEDGHQASILLKAGGARLFRMVF